MLVFYVILAVVIAAAATALVVKHSMHWTVFAGAALLALILPLPVSAITLAVAKSDQQTFHEYWNGFETAATTEVVTCVRDGSCVHTYDCDAELEYYTEYYTDSEGKRQSRQASRTKYHSCPYSSEETSFYVDTTIDRFLIARAAMTGEPFRPFRPIPGGQVTEAPAAWTAAQERIERGEPGGVTAVKGYKNYILGSKQSIFKRYSEAIDELRAASLLPDVTKGVTEHYVAPKLHVLGDVGEVDTAELQASLRQLNGAVGTDLRGDLHVVLVEADALPMSPEDYSNAVMAHWQNPKTNGRDTLAKNAIVLIVGVEGYRKPADEPIAEEETPTEGVTPAPLPTLPPAEETLPPYMQEGTPVVKWATAYTGMPVGNEALLAQLRSDLPGEAVDEDFLGTPVYSIGDQAIIFSSGAVEDILWGPNRFERVSMEVKDESDTGTGFGYLSDEWQPDAGVMAIIFVIGGLLSAITVGLGVGFSIAARSGGSRDFVRYFFTKHDHSHL